MLYRLSYASQSFRDRGRHTCGGNRTPSRRFWRPVLYQLSYARKSRLGGDKSALLLYGQGQNRTVDTTIFSRVLYQLSYLALTAILNHP